MVAGIDVSHYQAEIDWSEVAASGVRFAYIKATEGASYVDPLFEANWKGASDAGLIVGAYHFLTDSDPAQQARNFRTVVSALHGLPPAVDIELPSLNSAFVLQFLKDMSFRDALPPSVRAVLYVDRWLAEDLPGLEAYPLWIAEYDVPAPSVGLPWSRWTFWQHSQNGSVLGIDGPVDLNWFNGPMEDLALLAATAT